MMKITYAAIAAMICAALLAISQPASAAPLTWDGGGVDSNWSTAGNWSPDQTPVGGDALVYTAPTSNTKFAQTNDLTAGTQINGITFSNAVGGFTFGGNKINLGGNLLNNSTNATGNQTFNFAIDLVGADRTISANNGRIVTLAGSIGESGGSYGLTVSNTSSGVVYLDGANTYSGPTAVTAGFLALRNSAALGNSSGATVSSGATLQLENNISVAGVNATISGTGVSGTRGALASWSGTNSWSGGVTLAADSTILGFSGALNINGVIDETGGARVLTKTGGGTVTLSGSSANTNTGTTIVAHVGAASFAPLVLNKTAGVNAIGGNLQIGNNGAGYATVELGAANQIADAATITFSGTAGNWGYFKMLGRNETVAGLNSAANGVIENMESEVVNTNSTLTLGGAGTYSYNGFIRNKAGGAGTGTIGLTKTGDGSQTLVGSNITYTGATTVDDGVLGLQNTSAFASAVVVNAGGTLASERTVAGFANRLAILGNAVSGAGVLDINNAANTAGTTNGGWTTFSGATNSLNFSGTININSGVLSRDNTQVNTINGTATINVAADAAFGAGRGGGSTIGALNGAGHVGAFWTGGSTGSITLGNGGGSGSFSGVLHGNGAASDGSIDGGVLNVVKTGAGTQILSGANTYSGTTTINQGVLQIGAAGASGTLGTGAVSIASGANLTFNRNNAYAAANAISGAGNLTQAGAGTTTLSGAGVAYTGSTAVNDGRLVLSNTTGFRSNTTIASGGTLEMAVSSGTLTVPAAYTINGAGTLVKSGAGNWTIGGVGIQVTMAMSAGGLIDIQGGVLQNNNVRNMWTGNQASLNIASGATLDIFSDHVYVNALTGAGTVQNGYAPNGVYSLTVGVAGGSGTFSGAIVSGGGNVALTKSGAGTQILTGANTYGGATTINGGTLQIGGAGQLNAGAYAGAIANSGTFKYSSSAAQTLSGAITGTGALVKDSANSVLTLSNAGTNYTGATTVSQGTLKLTNATGFRSATSVSSGATLELNATAGWIPANNWSISGTGTVVKSGSGQMDLTWTGSQFVAFNLGASALIDVQEGSLRHGNGYDDTIWENNLASLNVASGAKFDVWDYGATSGKSVRVNALTGAGTVDKGWVGSATMIVGVGNGSGTFSGTIQNVAGTLNLVKSGAGTQTLSGANTYTGTTTINGGTLRVNGTHTTAGAYLVNAGGTLGGTGSITTNNANITVAAGGKLSPGASPGTLTLNLGSGTLNLSGITAGALVFELGPIGANDQVVLNTGTLNLGTLDFNEFNFIAVSGTSLGTYKLFDLAGSPATTLSGSIGTASGTFSSGRWGGSIWLNGQDVMLTLDFTSVPEPNSVLLVLGVAAALGLAVRRRKPQTPPRQI